MFKLWIILEKNRNSVVLDTRGNDYTLDVDRNWFRWKESHANIYHGFKIIFLFRNKQLKAKLNVNIFPYASCLFYTCIFFDFASPKLVSVHVHHISTWILMLVWIYRNLLLRLGIAILTNERTFMSFSIGHIFIKLFLILLHALIWPIRTSKIIYR